MDIDWTYWDESCYDAAIAEVRRLGDISENRGAEEIPVLVDWEVQRWIAEALEGEKQASELVGDRITQIGVQCTTRDRKRSRNESGGSSPAARKARQAVLDAARGDPISDSQLERLVRLTLGKRAPFGVETGKAVVACITAVKAGNGDAAQAPVAAAEFAHGRQPKFPFHRRCR